MSTREFMTEISLATVVSFLFGEITPAIKALVIFFIINTFLGFIKGIVLHELSSKKFIYGIFKGVCISFMLIIGNQMDLIYPQGLGGLANFRDIFLYFYVMYLLISILENYTIIGMPFPESIKKVLEVLKEEEKVK